MDQIKVPTTLASSDFGDDGHPMAKLLLQWALKAAFILGPPKIADFATRMNNFLAGLASAAIDPSPYVETIMGLGRKLIKINVLEEERKKRQESNEESLLQDLETNLEKAKKEWAKFDESNMPLYSEREQTCSKINIFEDTIRKLESTLAEARGDVTALKGHLLFIDAKLVEVEHNAIAKSARVQALESEYVRA